MKIVMIPMSVEQDTFNQVVELPSETILELIEAVLSAAMVSPKLKFDRESKMAAGLLMMASANEILEQSGCSIDVEISNPEWTHSVKYRTKGGQSGE